MTKDVTSDFLMKSHDFHCCGEAVTGQVSAKNILNTGTGCVKCSRVVLNGLMACCYMKDINLSCLTICHGHFHMN